MAKMSVSIPMSDLPSDTQRVLHELTVANEPVFLTEMGETTTVVMSAEAYRQSEAKQEILRLLARGESEIAQGLSYSLEEVLAEADARLAKD